VHRGSRTKEPLRPVTNIWKIRSEGTGLRADDHIRSLIERLEPAKCAIRVLADSQSDVQTRFEIVRYFDTEDGEEEIIEETPEGLIKIAGQHQLLGWELTTDLLEFFSYIRADLWFDEYG
jgi:hypothetical protein